MTNELTKIIVKVGNGSKVKFSQCKTFRAIMAEELTKLSKANEDCNIVIIESIYEDEQEAVKNFVIDFNNIDEKHNVFFFIPDNNEITSGIADELEYDIYLSLDDLYKAIYNIYNVNVSVYMDDKAKYNSIASESDIPSMDFGEIPGFEDTINSTNNETETPETPETPEPPETAVETTEISEEEDENTENKDETTSNSDIDMNSDAVIALKMELKDLKADYKQAVKDIKEANEQAEKLENVIKAITDEKNDILERFNTLMSDNEVIEDPIAFAEYAIKEKRVTELEASVKDLESTIENLKKSLEDSKKQSEELEETNRQLNEKIESGELEQKVIDDYTIKLDEATNSINEFKQTIEELEHKVEELSLTTTTLTNTKNTLETEKAELLEEKSKLEEEKGKLEEEIKALQSSLVEANETIADFRNKYETTKEEYDKLMIENTDNINEIGRLNTSLESANKIASLANNYADSKQNELEHKISDLEAHINILTEQLENKENQYKLLVEQSKNSSNETMTLANANNNLDMMNKTLREKLGTAAKEIERYKKNKEDMERSLQQYQAQVKRLTDTLNSVSGTGNPIGVTKASIQKALYNGRAQIITVMGSGSFGITTTAMSVASRLSTTSKVLYLDFDLVAPKADAWFVKNPICRGIPEINSGDPRMSGLGIFYEKGFDTFMKFASSIIYQCDRTKGGGVDYISGVYYRVDSSKITDADYASLFNFLGSMYQYIVIDLGRLGNSEVNDNLIKMLSDIATKNIVVTTKDIFEVRNFKWKLAANNINLKDTVWLINMCEDTNLDEKTRQMIEPCKVGFMLNDASLHGHREKFTRNKLNKDRLDVFVNTVLFAK